MEEMLYLVSPWRLPTHASPTGERAVGVDALQEPVPHGSVDATGATGRTDVTFRNQQYVRPIQSELALL